MWNTLRSREGVVLEPAIAFMGKKDVEKKNDRQMTNKEVELCSCIASEAWKVLTGMSTWKQCHERNWISSIFGAFNT